MVADAQQGTIGGARITLLDPAKGLSRQTDLSVRRHFRLFEGLGVDFRADAFNLFNTANFANPTGVRTGGNLGRSTQLASNGLGGRNPLFRAGGPRSMQLSLKSVFRHPVRLGLRQ